MEAGFMVIAFVAVGIAFVMGYLLGRVTKRKGVQGTIYIARDEPTGRAYPYLESNISVDELASMHRATFDIETISQTSHE